MSERKPGYIANLEAVYGPPNAAGFGSAIFHEKLEDDEDLENVAQGAYRCFVGKLWERWGRDVWMSPWREVYTRPVSSGPRDIVAELRGINEPGVAASVPLIVEVGETPERTHAVLSAAFDNAEVTELRVFAIGDGEAISGLLVAGKRTASASATLLVAMMD